MDEGTRYHLLRLLERNPALTQRELARELDFSLGKTNYCLRMLVEKGWVKLGNFRRSRNKSAYLYQLTPSGLAAKARSTRRFLELKLREHEHLTRQIQQLREEVAAPEPAAAGTRDGHADAGQGAVPAPNDTVQGPVPRPAAARARRAGSSPGGRPPRQGAGKADDQEHA